MLIRIHIIITAHFRNRNMLKIVINPWMISFYSEIVI